MHAARTRKGRVREELPARGVGGAVGELPRRALRETLRRQGPSHPLGPSFQDLPGHEL